MTIQTLTDEQRAFVEAIRDFAQRECGTREQRDALTDDGREPHNQELYERIAELGWLGVAIPEAVRRLGRRRRRHVPAVRGVARGHDPDGLLRRQHDHRRRGRAVRHRGAEAGDPRRRSPRGRVEAIAMSEPEAGSDVGNLVLPGRARQRRLRDQRPEDVDHRRPRRRPHPARVPHQPDRQQARGADDDLGPDRTSTGSRSAASTRWAAARSTTCSSPTARSPAERLLGAPGPGVDAADGRAQPRAADHRRAGAGHGPARVRRRARLRQGAQAVRPADRQLPGARSTGSPTSPPRSRRPGCWSTTPPPRSTPTRAPCSRARRRWAS